MNTPKPNDIPEQQPAHGIMRRRRVVRDRAVSALVTSSGWLILITLVVLVWHLLSQAFPVFVSPSVSAAQHFTLPDGHRLLMMNDVLQGRAAISRDNRCQLHFLLADEKNTQFASVKRLPTLCDEKIQAFQARGLTYLSRITPSGILRVERVRQFQQQFTHDLMFSMAVPLEYDNQPLGDWLVELGARDAAVVAQYGDAWRVMWAQGYNPDRLQITEIAQGSRVAAITALGQVAVHHGNTLWLLDKQGQRLSHVDVSGTVTHLSVPPGGRALLIGLASGELQKWQALNVQGSFRFQRAWRATDIAAQSIRFAPGSNAYLVAGGAPEIILLNGVTGEVLTRHQVTLPIRQLGWSDDQVLWLQDDLAHISALENIAGTVTARALWQAQPYEGHAQPEFIWQTTNGSDYQTAKFSLVPLVIGSMKAAILSLMIAVPLALGTAIYTAFFATPKIRNTVKPTVEMIEAIPSVVVGFVAAVWLSPLAEEFLFTLALFIVVAPLSLWVFARWQRPIMTLMPVRFRHGFELPVMLVLLMLMGILLLNAGPWLQQHIEAWLGYQQWSVWAEQGAGKSTLVVAIALGIAIAPSIYSLAEDALHGVPKSMKLASYALGATRLQTLQRVVLVMAYPGILSAVVLGFGRAFGETMIVLMVTGNSPVSDWNPFASLRALTANLAIELPEAEVGSAHYHVLFLTALMLFVFTFVINTLAEVLRRRLRKGQGHV